ncbi:unnamed protein product [Microthlaspi erraticum]|uniref:Uncharacterized protein n=1 Tax=Microthlaspi erraticum TaxID=1685480 RepID=A0A6D2IAW0_9BRAS|nr:unnamed protein product [Microthlaspi erraticum]
MGFLVEAFVALILLSLGFAITESAPESSLVTKLPGFNGSFPSKHYAGYVAINKERNKNLWYYFVESERNASTDPVVLWLNGGPGCSSMDGFVYEHGPFNFEHTKTKAPRLHLNRYSWSKVSNIIYLDSPVGVGYSYSKDKSDYITNDTQTASDSYAFLIEGYLVGNGCTDPVFDGNALVPFAHGMGLISSELFEETKAACNGQYYISGNTTNGCSGLIQKVKDDVSLLNKYDILESCYHDTSMTTFDIGSLPPSFFMLGKTERPLPVRKRMFGRAWPLGANVRPGFLLSWPQLLADSSSLSCMDDRVATTWLSDPSVRKAVHAKQENEIGSWKLCTNQVLYTHDTGSMIAYHRNLTLNGYRALIFSGDHDMCVPFTGSEAWTKSMGYKVVDEWRPWMSYGQVAGFTQGYANNLTFLTIKGAGHTVPEYKPREALDFYSRFLAGEKM